MTFCDTPAAAASRDMLAMNGMEIAAALGRAGRRARAADDSSAANGTDHADSLMSVAADHAGRSVPFYRHSLSKNRRLAPTSADARPQCCARGRSRRARRGEQAKAGRARAGHARQARSRAACATPRAPVRSPAEARWRRARDRCARRRETRSSRRGRAAALAPVPARLRLPPGLRCRASRTRPWSAPRRPD